MKTTLEPQDIDAIALRVVELLVPHLPPPQPTQDEFITVDEAAALLRTAPSRIYQKVSDARHGIGTFPFMKEGQRLLFSKSALLEWLAGR